MGPAFAVILAIVGPSALAAVVLLWHFRQVDRARFRGDPPPGAPEQAPDSDPVSRPLSEPWAGLLAVLDMALILVLAWQIFLIWPRVVPPPPGRETPPPAFQTTDLKEQGKPLLNGLSTPSPD